MSWGTFVKHLKLVHGIPHLCVQAVCCAKCLVPPKGPFPPSFESTYTFPASLVWLKKYYRVKKIQQNQTLVFSQNDCIFTTTDFFNLQYLWKTAVFHNDGYSFSPYHAFPILQRKRRYLGSISFPSFLRSFFPSPHSQTSKVYLFYTNYTKMLVIAKD